MLCLSPEGPEKFLKPGSGRGQPCCMKLMLGPSGVQESPPMAVPHFIVGIFCPPRLP